MIGEWIDQSTGDDAEYTRDAGSDEPGEEGLLGGDHASHELGGVSADAIYQNLCRFFPRVGGGGPTPTGTTTP